MIRRVNCQCCGEVNPGTAMSALVDKVTIASVEWATRSLGGNLSVKGDGYEGH